MIEERSDVGVQYPIDPLLPDSIRQCVQRIVLSAPGSEPIAEAQELRLVDRRQDRHHRSLDDLVFQSRDAERPLPAVRLGNVLSARGQRAVRSPMDAGMEVCEIDLQVLRIVGPCHAVDAGCGGLLQAEEPRPQHVNADVVQERRELFPSVPGNRLSYADLRA